MAFCSDSFALPIILLTRVRLTYQGCLVNLLQTSLTLHSEVFPADLLTQGQYFVNCKTELTAGHGFSLSNINPLIIFYYLENCGFD